MTHVTHDFVPWLDAVRAEFAAAKAAMKHGSGDNKPREKRLDVLLPIQFEHRGKLRWAAEIHRAQMWSAIAELACYVLGLLLFVCLILILWTPLFVWIALGALFLAALATRFVYGRLERPARDWLADAEIVPGALVEANDALFRPGPEVAANAGFVFTFDPALAADPERLAALAKRCAEIGDAKEVKPSEREVQRRMQGWREARDEEHPHVFDRVALPPEMAGNDATFLTCVGVSRVELLEGVIDRSFLPLLVRRGRNESAQLAPASLWPEVTGR
jgi:hypothetical protein